MKIFRKLLLVSALFLASAPTFNVQAQCAMCTLNADNSVVNGNTEGKGLNDGILYLLAAPYLAIAGIGFLWYKKYRKKSIPMRVKGAKINLN